MTSLLAFALFAARAEAALRKCTDSTLTDSRFIAGKVMVLINGEIVGEMYPGATRVEWWSGAGRPGQRRR